MVLQASAGGTAALAAGIPLLIEVCARADYETYLSCLPLIYLPNIPVIPVIPRVPSDDTNAADDAYGYRAATHR